LEPQLAVFLLKISCCQCPITCTALPDDPAGDQGNSPERAEISNIPAVPGAPFYVPAQKVARVEASTEMLRIPHESEENHVKGIATGDDRWLQCSYLSSKYLHDRRQTSFQGSGRPSGRSKL
jgi:hypothetical protein